MLTICPKSEKKKFADWKLYSAHNFQRVKKYTILLLRANNFQLIVGLNRAMQTLLDSEL